MTKLVHGQRLQITRFYEPQWRKSKSKQPRVVKVYTSNDGGGEYIFDSNADILSHNRGTRIKPEAVEIDWGNCND